MKVDLEKIAHNVNNWVEDAPLGKGVSRAFLVLAVAGGIVVGIIFGLIALYGVIRGADALIQWGLFAGLLTGWLVYTFREGKSDEG